MFKYFSIQEKQYRWLRADVYFSIYMYIYIQTRAFPDTSTGISHVILGFFSAKAIRITSIRKRWRNVMID